MEQILHFIGLCPDSMAHPDLLDFLLLQKEDLGRIFTSVKIFLWG
jgi:hypothetical protein